MLEAENDLPIISEIKSKISSKNRSELLRKCSYQPNSDVACTLTARLILDEARKLGLSGRAIDVDEFDVTGHTFVVLDDMSDHDYPLNRTGSMNLTVSEVTSEGRDVTNELIGSSYSQIM